MAYTGMSLLWGYADSPPDARIKVAQPDYIVAATQAVAVTAALHHRARTGQGQFGGGLDSLDARATDRLHHFLKRVRVILQAQGPGPDRFQPR